MSSLISETTHFRIPARDKVQYVIELTQEQWDELKKPESYCKSVLWLTPEAEIEVVIIREDADDPCEIYAGHAEESEK